MPTVTVDVEVEVGLDDYDDDDILEEALARGLSLGEGILTDSSEDIYAMFYAFRNNKLEQAIELAKKIAQDHTGRIL